MLTQQAQAASADAEVLADTATQTGSQLSLCTLTYEQPPETSQRMQSHQIRHSNLQTLLAP